MNELVFQRDDVALRGDLCQNGGLVPITHDMLSADGGGGTIRGAFYGDRFEAQLGRREAEHA